MYWMEETDDAQKRRKDMVVISSYSFLSYLPRADQFIHFMMLWFFLRVPSMSHLNCSTLGRSCTVWRASVFFQWCPGCGQLKEAIYSRLYRVLCMWHNKIVCVLQWKGDNLTLLSFWNLFYRVSHQQCLASWLLSPKISFFFICFSCVIFIRARDSS